jgi:hypothetical protein
MLDAESSPYFSAPYQVKSQAKPLRQQLKRFFKSLS